MGTNQTNAAFAQRLGTETEGIERGIVLGDIELVACMNLGNGFCRINLVESCSLQLLLECCDCKIIDGTGIQKVNQIHRLFLDDGNIEFVEWEHESGVAELLIYLILHIAHDCPVVGTLAPRTGSYGATAFAHVGQALPGTGNRFACDGFLEDKRARILNLFDGFAYGFVVGAVAEVKVDIHTTVWLLGIVDHRAGRKPAIGNDDGLVVGGDQNGVEDLDVLDDALVALCCDKVADLIGLEEEYHHTSGKIAQSARHGHTDGNTGTSKEADECGGIDTEDVDDGDDQAEPKTHLDDALEEALQRVFHALLVHHLGADLANLVDSPFADDINDNSDDNLPKECLDECADN